MDTTTKSIEELGIDTVRVLSADAVQKANSGHPGTAMALAPMGHVLWTQFLNYNPKNPHWANRDRFILSAAMPVCFNTAFCTLTGYDLTLDDIKNFRQLNSKTAGHPEYGLPAVLMLLPVRWVRVLPMVLVLPLRKNIWLHVITNRVLIFFDYHIYAICSDGDMMEGVTSEAASLAGHLELGNIIYLYDDNHISIEGATDITFNEDVSERFRAYGWHVQDLA